MSLYKDASLVMIPSAYKDGKLYSIRPTDGSGDFTFSRGSNLAATRVDVNGLIEKGRENLLLQSNQFLTGWTNYLSNETSGQVGYDGSNDAWLLTKTGASGHIAQAVSQSGVNTFSVYVKAGTLNWVRLIDIGGGNRERYFDLQNGVLGGSSYTSEIDSKIQSIGNGWYRCSITTNISFTQVRIYPAQGNFDTTGTSGNIYIQDAQLEAGLVATDYIETGASTAQAGILEDMPRLDYSGSCPALLLEPQRTNTLTNSEYFDGSPFTLQFATLTANAAISPEGVQNAYSFVPTTDGSGNHRIYDGSGASIQTATHSIFIKPNGHNYWALREATTTGASIGFDFTDNSIITEYSTGGCTASNGKIEPLENGWYRISGTFSFATATNNGFGFYAAAPTWTSGDVESVAWAGDGISGAYIYGAQIEAGSYPTSYIPTYGSSVTRSKDVCKNTSAANLIGQTEGVIFVEFDKKNGTAERRFFLQIGSGSTTIYARLESNNSLTTQILNGGTDYLTSTGTIIPSGNNKFAVAYANNDAVFYLNGTQLASSSSVVVPALSDLYIGSNSSTSQTIAGEIKQALLFKTRLTNAELAALTTI